MLVFFIVTIQRYRQQSFTYSSLSSQFLDNDKHFWALVPFHYGILLVLFGHVVAFLFPRAILAWNGHPVRLLILEVTALAAGLLTLIGLVNLVMRRWRNTRVRVVTSVADWILYAMLIVAWARIMAAKPTQTRRAKGSLVWPAVRSIISTSTP